MKKYIFILIAAVFIESGCRKYVEIDQIGIRTLKYTTDYRNVLNNNDVLEGAYGYPLLSGDDTNISDATRQANITDIWSNVYIWNDAYTSDIQGDADWEKLYKTIYVCNTVTDGVMSSQGGSDADKQKLYAEALVHRAYAYQCLVGLYAKQYDVSTASVDLGVPLLLTSNLFTPLNRATVSTVYNQIIADLKYSINSLPSTPDYNVRPSKVAVYALLSRTFMNTRDFSQASLYADSALALQNTLLDLKTYASAPGTIPRRLLDPEVILSKIVNGSYTAIPISDDVINLLTTNDLRYSLFTNTRSGYGSSFSASFTGRAYWRYTLNGEYVIQIGPSVPEMMLIKAECLARAGNATDAITILNSIRKKRFTDPNYTALSASTPSDALNRVIDERKRELFGRGFRWFDQKRYNMDPTLAITETRVFKTTTYTLAPNSVRYVYPIGSKYILLNPELQQNPR